MANAFHYLAALLFCIGISFAIRVDTCTRPELSIPPTGGSSDSIEDSLITHVSQSSDIIRDVEATVKVTHTRIGDLKISLRHEGTGDTVVLLDKSCGDREDLDIIFSDRGNASLNCDDMTQGKKFAPVNALAVFNTPLKWSRDSRHTWSIVVTDDTDSNEGTLDEWCISFEIEKPTYVTAFTLGNSWEEARESCASRYGTDLAVIGSDEENARAAELCDDLCQFLADTACLCYIGLSDKDEEGTFTWVDGSAVTYEKWASNEPDDKDIPGYDPVTYQTIDGSPNADCVAVTPSGGWYDVACAGNPFFALCKAPCD